MTFVCSCSQAIAWCRSWLLPVSRIVASSASLSWNRSNAALAEVLVDQPIWERGNQGPWILGLPEAKDPRPIGATRAIEKAALKSQTPARIENIDSVKCDKNAVPVWTVSI